MRFVFFVRRPRPIPAPVTEISAVFRLRFGSRLVVILPFGNSANILVSSSSVSAVCSVPIAGSTSDDDDDDDDVLLLPGAAAPHALHWVSVFGLTKVQSEQCQVVSSSSSSIGLYSHAVHIDAALSFNNVHRGHFQCGGNFRWNRSPASSSDDSAVKSTTDMIVSLSLSLSSSSSLPLLLLLLLRVLLRPPCFSTTNFEDDDDATRSCDGVTVAEDGVGSFLKDDDDDGNREDAGIAVAPAVHGVGLTRLRCTALVARAAAGFDWFLFLLCLSLSSSSAVVPANRRGTVRVREDVRGSGSTIVLMATKCCN